MFQQCGIFVFVFAQMDSLYKQTISQILTMWYFFVFHFITYLVYFLYIYRGPRWLSELGRWIT